MDNNNNKTKEFALDLLFPKFCLGCQKEGFYLCEDCRSVLDISEYNYCLCSKAPAIIPPLSERGKCTKCQNKKLSGLYSALPYKENFLTKKLIYQFKYQPYIKDLATVLASIIIEHFIISKNNAQTIWQNCILIPVPLDKNKIKVRGYNQSEELAKKISEVIRIPVITDCLIKNLATKPQMELSKEEREKNLINVFTVKNTEKIKNEKIFLVDDVYTTGSTMEECAKALKEAGAKQVWGIVFARESQ